MGDFLVFLAQALRAFGEWLSSRTQVPWPLVVGALLPVYAAGLSASIWWMRGRCWPVLCAYPSTTKGHACRNRVTGEWRRCHHHRRSRRRRTDQHTVVPELRRWQSVSRQGQVGTRADEVGRGLLLMNGRMSTLLYRRGFARPPTDVLRFVPVWWRESVELMRVARLRLQQVRDAPGRWRAILWSTPPSVGVVSDRLPVVIRATRFSVYAVAAGLLLVVTGVLLPPAAAPYADYCAAACFFITWAVLKQGVWLAEPAWLRLAGRDAWRWGWPFVAFAVVGGTFLR